MGIERIISHLGAKALFLKEAVISFKYRRKQRYGRNRGREMKAKKCKTFFQRIRGDETMRG